MGCCMKHVQMDSLGSIQDNYMSEWVAYSLYSLPRQPWKSQLIFQESILSHNIRMRSKGIMLPVMVPEKKPQNVDSLCSLGMRKCKKLPKNIMTLSYIVLPFILPT